MDQNIHYPIKEFGCKNTENKLHIWWSVTTQCDLNCWYCSFVRPEDKFSPPSVYNPIIDFINEQKSKRNNVRLDLFGGEPTLHPDFINILKKINVSNVVLNTNLNMSTDKLKRIMETNVVTKYILSWHYNICNNIQFEKNLNLLLEKNAKIELILMLEKDYIDDILALFQKYKHINCYINCIHQHKDFLDPSIKEKIYKKMKLNQKKNII